MRRLLAAAAVLLPLCVAGAGTAAESVRGGRMGELPIVLPDGDPRGLVFLFSDGDGWGREMEAAARRLARLGAIVLEVDLPTYLANLRASDDGCHYLISEVEGTSKGLQRTLALERYLMPILAGVGMGGALAYGGLAQAPAATVAGAASARMAFLPRLATEVPLCPGAAAAPAGADGGGFTYGPRAGLHGWWRVAVDRERREAAGAFVAGVPEATPVRVGSYAPLAEILPVLLAEPLAASEAAPSELADLPLVELPAAVDPGAGPGGDTLAIIYSGDGGWRDLDKTIGETLQKAGVAVVGVDSLRYFWHRRAPEEVADDLAAIIGHYTEAWSRPRVVLIGYSFGAGVLPFAVNRLPEPLRDRVAQVSLLGLGPRAEFEVHVTDWLGTGPDPEDPAVIPEVSRLDPARVQCFYGREEEDTACTHPAFAGAERIEIEGGHHFDGDYAGLARRILAGLRDHHPGRLPRARQPGPGPGVSRVTARTRVRGCRRRALIPSHPSVGRDGHRGWLYALAVAPEWRRAWLGRRVVAKARAWLGAGAGVPKVMPTVRDDNAGVVAFYRRQGYAVEPRTILSRWLKSEPGGPSRGTRSGCRWRGAHRAGASP